MLAKHAENKGENPRNNMANKHNIHSLRCFLSPCSLLLSIQLSHLTLLSLPAPARPQRRWRQLAQTAAICVRLASNPSGPEVQCRQTLVQRHSVQTPKAPARSPKGCACHGSPLPPFDSALWPQTPPFLPPAETPAVHMCVKCVSVIVHRQC